MNQKQLNLFSAPKLEVTLSRICYQLKENHGDFKDSVIIGIQPRGVFLSRRIRQLLTDLFPEIDLPYGELDVTFFRDDFRRHEAPLQANTTSIDFNIENKRVILIDDVLYTGRTIRAAMDAMLAFGRPDDVELLVLVERRRKRDLPIEAKYTGIKVDTLDSEKVIVRLVEGGGQDTVKIESI